MSKQVEGQLIVGDDGSLVFRTTNGTFEQGTAIIARLVQLMGEKGVTIPPMQVEQHSHGPDGEHVPLQTKEITQKK